MPDFLDAVRSTVSRHRMVRRGDRVLAAVSGGPDSTALLLALAALREEIGFSLKVVYVNHGLQPAAVRRESARVRELGRRFKAPVFVVKVNVLKKGGQSLETEARRLRHEALERLARKAGCRVIALGHTSDDQAETVLMRLLRGAGSLGLSGIRPVRSCGGSYLKMIRPLLELSRSDVSAFLKEQGVRALEDRSNLSPRFLRNRIRRVLIPFLEKAFSPMLKSHLTGLAGLLREEQSWLAGQVAKEFRRIGWVRKGAVRLDRSGWKKIHPALRRGVLRLSVERLQGDGSGFRRRHWEALDRMLLTGAPPALDLPHGLRINVSRNKELVKIFRIH